MFCGKRGSTLKEGAAFCPKCGGKVPGSSLEKKMLLKVGGIAAGVLLLLLVIFIRRETGRSWAVHSVHDYWNCCGCRMFHRNDYCRHSQR